MIIIGKTIAANFLDRSRNTPQLVGFTRKVGGKWVDATYGEFHEQCKRVSFGLMSLGIRPGDKIAILSSTRFEWSLADMAIVGSRAVTVPIYPSNLPADCAYILNHSEARVVFVEDATQLEKLYSVRQELKVEKIIAFEPSAMKAAAGRDDTLTLASLEELGRRAEAAEPLRFERNLLDARPGDLVTICYTSGTTGVPKGAMITHDNMVSVLEDCERFLGLYIEPEKETILSFLPFSHIVGKAESLAGYSFGWRQYFAESFEKLPDNLPEARPTVIFSVPRVFEKAHARILAMVAAAPPSRRRAFERALEVGGRCYRAMSEGKSPSPIDLVRMSIARRLVFSRIRSRFGGRLKFALCGSAPLPEAIGEFFAIAGIRIVEAYGLTETSAPVTMNSPDRLRFGTVGKPLPEVSLKIAADGEILIKSRKVFKGYYKMPAETEAALEGGWFHTGDIGVIDGSGYLRITDRKKDLIITSGGKNVAPQKIEGMAREHPFISQFVVHGDRRNYLTALVVLDRERVQKIAEDESILHSGYAELLKHEKIQARVQAIVDAVNSKLASFETVKKFIIVPDEFSIETGELTPSLKVRRKVVNEKYRAEFDRMYSEGGA